MSISCSNQECYRSLDTITEEMQDCLVFLYVGAAFFFVLAVYLHEILPQDPDENGLTKSPLFFLHNLINFFRRHQNQKKKLLDDIYENVPEELNSQVSSEEGDRDCQNERTAIHNFQGNFRDFPLVCKGISKV